MENKNKEDIETTLSIVKGCVFSIYSDMGPISLLSYPFPQDSPNIRTDLDIQKSPFYQRNNMQVAYHIRTLQSHCRFLKQCIYSWFLMVECQSITHIWKVNTKK